MIYSPHSPSPCLDGTGSGARRRAGPRHGPG